MTLNPTHHDYRCRQAADSAVPDAPESRWAGDVKIASFNVLNYFTTLGTTTTSAGCTFKDRDGEGNHVSAGSTSAAPRRGGPRRQQDKIVSAINALDADVVGLMEIENSAALGETADEATNSLVAALNAAAGSRSGRTTRPRPSARADRVDVITNAIIYKRRRPNG